MLCLFSHFTMKRLFFPCLVLLVVSCKKSDINEQSLPAAILTNVSYSTDASQKMDVYLPAGRNADSTKLMVLVHGGAWISGDKSDFTLFIPVIQQRFPGYAIVNINYRLATPTIHHFPTQENDMKAALDYLIQKSGEYKVSQKFVLLGASAGAHMALLQAYKYSSPKILAVVDFFGPTDMTDLYNFHSSDPNNQLLLHLLMSGTPVSNASLYAQSSPLNFITAQSSPTIIFHGSMDDVVPIKESTALKNRLSSFGVINEMTSYPNVGHEIWSENIMRDVYDKMERFIKTNVH